MLSTKHTLSLALEDSVPCKEVSIASAILSCRTLLLSTEMAATDRKWLAAVDGNVAL